MKKQGQMYTRKFNLGPVKILIALIIQSIIDKK